MPEPKHHTGVIDTERELRQQNEALRKALRDVLDGTQYHSSLCSIYWESAPDTRCQCDCAIGAARAHAESLLAEKI